MSVEVRPYVDTDEQAVASLWSRVFSDMPPWNDPETNISRKLSVQRELFLVATVGQVVVGTAMAGFDGHRGWVYYVAVNPDYRRQGIGRSLMQRVEHDLASVECPKLNLQVRAQNLEAVKFYQSLGYGIEERVSMSKLLTRERV